MRSRMLGQPLPGIFLEKAQRGVEGGPAPHFQRKQVGMTCGVDRGDAQHVIGAHPRGQQRLVGVAEGGVGQQQLLLIEDPAAELFGAQFAELVAPALARLIRVGSVSDGPRTVADASAAAPALARMPETPAAFVVGPLTMTSAMYAQHFGRPVLAQR